MPRVNIYNYGNDEIVNAFHETGHFVMAFLFDEELKIKTITVSKEEAQKL